MVFPLIVAAASVAVSVVAPFLGPAAAPAVAMMVAPGAGGALISKAAFSANPKLYYLILRRDGAKAAVAVFAP
ncbi:hypothetical protein BS78_02G344600 [Paspalum vaginatum]|nr:hypothetical protein BS78_02G344600 [Paspalum vaginatum]